MKRNSLLPAVAALAIGMLGLASTAQAALIATTDNLPPDGVYLGIDIHQIYGGPALQFLLTLPAHAPIAAMVDIRAGGAGLPGTTPADEVETFGSTLTAMMDVTVNGVSQIGGPQPIFASGPFGSVQTVVYDKIGNPDGDYDTEMLQLNLSGTTPLGGFMIRESPTLPSPGHTTITPLPGGLFQIDSFFDVFTELSIDGGATWMPSHDGAGNPASGHMVLVPEPSRALLALVGIAAIGLRRRRS